MQIASAQEHLRFRERHMLEICLFPHVYLAVSQSSFFDAITTHVTVTC